MSSKRKRMLYLSRHGETYDNLRSTNPDRDDLRNLTSEDLDELTAKGAHQANILGKYLKQYLIEEKSTPKEDIIILTSNQQRSADTGYVILNILGVDIENIIFREGLHEQTPREAIRQIVPQEDNNEIKEYLKSFRLAREIARDVNDQLVHVIETYPDKTIIAPLHGNINRIFLHKLGIKKDSFGNCALIPLSYSDGNFAQAGEYKTNNELELILKKRK